MSFDAAKVRRFLRLNKQIHLIVCEHSLFIDAYQRKKAKLGFLFEKR